METWFILSYEHSRSLGSKLEIFQWNNKKFIFSFIQFCIIIYTILYNNKNNNNIIYVSIIKLLSIYIWPMFRIPISDYNM